MAQTAKEVIFKITGDTKGLETSITEANRHVDTFTKKSQKADEVLTKLAKTTALATTALSALGITAAKMAVDFNRGFGEIQTLIPGATERIKELQKNVLDLAPAVGKSTEDLTKGLYQIISAFGDSAESAKNLELSAKAATAGGASTLEAINLLSAVTKGYGDTSNEAQEKVSDLAFTTVKLGQTIFPELASSMQRVTALSKEMGVSQEEMFAVFSSGTGVIGGASEVSTKLAQVYNELLKPQAKMQESFKKLGVETGQELIQKFNGLQGALTALKKSADEVGEPISNLFGSIEAGQLALYATGSGAQKLTSDLTAMSEAVGATNQAFYDATEGGVNAFGFQLEKAKQNAHNLMIKVGQELIPSLQNLLTPLFKSVEFLNNLDSATLSSIVSVGKVALAITATATAGIGLVKAINAIKLSMIALNTALLANPFILAATAIVGIGLAITEIEKASQKAKKAQNELIIQSETAAAREAQTTRKLVDEYTLLSEKTKLTTQEKTRLKEISEKLKKTFPELTTVYDKNTGALKLNKEELQKLNQEKIQSLKQNLASLIQEKQEAEIQLKKIKSEQEILSSQYQKKSLESGGLDYGGELDTINAKIGKNSRAQQDYKNQIENTSQAIKEYKKILQELESSQEKTTPQETKNPAIFDTKDTEKKDSSQGARLKALDDAYNREKEIIKNRTTDELTKNQELLASEQKYYTERMKLLENFNQEDMQKGLTLAESNKSVLKNLNTTIIDEKTKTKTQIESLEENAYQKELKRIKTITEETIKQAQKKAHLKKETGQITQEESEKETLQITLNDLKKEQLNLENLIIASEQKGSKNQNKKIILAKKELKEITESIDETSKKIKNLATMHGESLRNQILKVRKDIQTIGTEIVTLTSDLSSLAVDIIGNQDEKQKQKATKRLAQLEREKNETLLAIDEELNQQREQKRIEDAQREEEHRQAEYEKKLADYERNIQELEGTIALETNIEKIKAAEKELEAERKKKKEEENRKKAEDEKAKRDKKARMQEITLLNARAKAEHDFAVIQIQTENESGAASAKAAQEKAKWKKAETITSLILKAALETASAAASFAVMDFVGGSLHTAAAVIAGVQAGVVGSAPLPPDHQAQPLPKAPTPIKFAKGGLVMPSTGGTGIALPNGMPGIVGEAGSPEMILPITAPNLDKVFKAAGITNQTTTTNPLNFAPNYHIEISAGIGDVQSEIIEALRTHDREAISIIENARREYYVD